MNTLPPPTIRGSFQELWRYRYVVSSYVTSTLRLRYRRSYLGFLWTVVAPLAHYCLIGFMLFVLMQNPPPNYFRFYFTGAVFFAFVSAVVNRAPHILLNNEHFIKKIYMPKIIFVLSGVFYEVANFLLASGTLAAVAVICGTLPLSFALPSCLISVVLTSLFLLGITCVLSVGAVYFRDLVHIVPVAMQGFFFVTPVAFTQDMLPARLRWVVDANPLYYFLESFRRPILDGLLPLPSHLAIAAGLAFVTCGLGILMLRKFDNRIVFRL